LITCLVHYYLDDDAETNRLRSDLRTFCPTIFSADDARTVQATEMIEQARNLPPGLARKELLEEAVKLLRSSVQKLKLPLICELLYEVNYVQGIADLVLARAEKDDPKMLALIAYKNRLEDSEVFAREAIMKRKEAYRCITSTLDRIMVDERSLGTGDQLNPSKDIVIRSVFDSKDELAHVAVFKWLLEHDFVNVVLQSKSPYLESFLHRRVEEGGSSRSLDLLWRFHERSGDHRKATDLLFELAQRETDKLSIDRRVAYLSQAAMCARSASSEADPGSNIHDLIVEIGDKLDVAQVQLATKLVLTRLLSLKP
uniref:Nucleoporin_C domain-containing protein n=1 Tax=Gongylonema pulchrum TaxID=637853 RepID=A0A183D473_9BILA